MTSLIDPLIDVQMRDAKEQPAPMTESQIESAPSQDTAKVS